MSTPEPLDEFASGPAETRGGDRFADIIAPPVPDDCDDLSCDCGEE